MTEANVTARPAKARSSAGPNRLADGPIATSIIRLAFPNLIAISTATLVSVAETAYAGRIGLDALGGMAVVFPIVVLQQSLSNGAMGGGVSSAVSRALGAGDHDRAEAMALHALVLAVVLGLLTSLVMLLFAPLLWHALGARAGALEGAMAYGEVAFLGSTGVWMTGLLLSVLRGSGNMQLSASITFVLLLVQIAVGALFCFGLGPVPAFGMAGIAAGLSVAYGGAGLVLVMYLRSTRAHVRLRFAGMRLSARHFGEILSVGLPTCIAPFQSVLTVVITTALISRHGPEALAGYGIGARLEMVMIPLAFAIGVACLPMVGVAIGAGNVARAKRVAATGAGIAAATVGCIGILAAIWPEVWPRLFTGEEQAIGHAAAFLVRSGPAYLFFGLGLCLLFASQGARKVGGPVLAGTTRLAIVISGGALLSHLDAGIDAYFWLTAVGMVAYGLFAGTAVRISDWGKRNT